MPDPPSINTPDGFEPIARRRRDSTIAHFVDGVRRVDSEPAASDEILVWLGSTIHPDPGAHLVSHLGNEPPAEACYIIERFDDGPLVEERFAETKAEAIETANDLVAAVLDEAEQSR